ncbi:MAG: response regulator [Candidatus Nomurabacteria bacterium]|nr:response regulator [Candidatus Nomurabacteria bacterium]
MPENNPKKILILEDEKSLVRSLELKLVHEGYEVTTLQSGEGFEGLLEKNNFSLIICDLMMPKVDGFHVLQIIKDKNMKIPVIILTNLGQVEDEARVKSFGVSSEFFIKSDTSLLKIVSSVNEKLSQV